MVDYLSKSWADAAYAGWNGPGWYFWDETQSVCYGPYETEEDARQQMAAYCETLMGPPPQGD